MGVCLAGGDDLCGAGPGIYRTGCRWTGAIDRDTFFPVTRGLRLRAGWAKKLEITEPIIRTGDIWVNWGLRFTLGFRV